MEFTLNPHQFEQLAWIAKTAPQRPPTPILSGVKLTPNESGFTAETFDYTTHTTAKILAENVSGETIIVPGRILAEIVSALPKKSAHFRVDSGKMEVQCGSSKFRLNTMDAGEYPPLPTAGEPLGCVSADILIPSLTRAFTAASKDDALSTLTSILFELADSSISLLSTDRYRLTVADLPWDGEPGMLLVPARAVHDVARSLTGQITISASHSMVSFADVSRTIAVSLNEGEFPPARRLIPAETSTVACVNVKELTDVVKRVSILADRGTPIRLTFNASTVTVDAGDEDQTATESLELSQPLTGEPVTTAFNPQFLLDGLAVQSSQDVLIGFTHPSKPVVFTPAGQESGSFTYLLVPIRI